MKYISKIVILSILVNISVLFFIPYTEIGGDWFYQSVAGQIQYQHGDFTPPKDRTPLFGLIIAVLNPTPQNYWITQIISVILSSFYLIPSYLIAKKIFDQKTAEISTLFMVFIPFMIFQTGYTWPKNTAMFFILFAMYFIFLSDYKHRYLLSGFMFGIGYWFHNFTGIYIITALILMTYYKVNHKITVLTTFIITLIPYLIWIYLYYGTIFTSMFMYYPISVEYAAPMTQTPEHIKEVFLSTPIIKIIEPHITNFLSTTTPLILFAQDRPTFNILYYYTHTYIGGLSTILYLVILYAFFKRNTNKFIKLMVIIPVILFSLWIGWREWGILPAGLQPTIPLLVMLGINEIKDDRNYLHCAFFLVIIDTIIFIILYQQFFTTINGVADVTKLLEPYNISFTDFKSLYYLLW